MSDRAYTRGYDQCGTLGSGNHFLEVQVVDRVLDEQAASVMGLREGQIHRPDPLRLARARLPGLRRLPGRLQRGPERYGFTLPDPQLACAPVRSPEGGAYLGAMRAAANYAWCNRQLLTHQAREVFARVFETPWEKLGLDLIYDVAHNIAKFEDHEVAPGETRQVCVHRKGATRAFPPGHPEVPAPYQEIGPARHHPRQRWGRRAGSSPASPGAMDPLLRHELPRRRPDDEPDRRRQALRPVGVIKG